MSSWNYVVTAHKPTSVTHSCVGNFTSPQELNLIVAYETLPLPLFVINFCLSISPLLNCSCWFGFRVFNEFPITS